jgi:hypothetical protein
MSYAADDVEAIARRMKELQAERDLALKGTSAPVDGQETKPEAPYGYAGYMSGYCDYTFSEDKLQAALGAVHRFGSKP